MVVLTLSMSACTAESSADRSSSGADSDLEDTDKTAAAKEMVKQLNSADQSRNQEQEESGAQTQREEEVEESKLLLLY